MKYIFDEIIETKDIYLLIDKHAPDDKTKQYLVTVVKDVIHHKVVDLVLDELDEERKTIFIEEIEDETKHQGVLAKLKDWIVDFEQKAVNKIKEAEKELIELIKV
jgi:hypothetical protein